MNARRLIAALCLLPASLLPAIGLADSPTEVGEVRTIQAQAQPWQARRAEFARLINNLDNKDPKTVEAFDAVLTEFIKKPFHRTPMENMEILGVYYVQVEGIEKTLPFIAANAALGWYDALRYGSESGRAEILHNEGFFKLPLVILGQDNAQLAIKFFTEQPEKTARLVQHGLALAESLKDDPRYDHQWPSAYGLERTLCALGAECQPPSAVPKAQWASAWEETKARVIRYYRINEAPAKAADKRATSKNKKR